MMQAVAITCEDLLLWAWRYHRQFPTDTQSSGTVRLVGYIWTFSWFTYTLSALAGNLMQSALLEADIPIKAMALGKEIANDLFLPYIGFSGPNV